MDHDDVQPELERLFWGVLRVGGADLMPPGQTGAEPTSVPIALARAQVIVYRREIAEVRAALGRIEAGGSIQDEFARCDRLEAMVEQMSSDMERSLRG
jgi:hypothetical protein